LQRSLAHDGLANGNVPLEADQSSRASLLVYDGLAVGEIVVLDQAQDGLRNLSAASNTRFDLVRVIFWFIANQPQVNYREPTLNGFTQNAIVEDIQSGGRQSLH